MVKVMNQVMQESLQNARWYLTMNFVSGVPTQDAQTLTNHSHIRYPIPHIVVSLVRIDFRCRIFHFPITYDSFTQQPQPTGPIICYVFPILFSLT